MKRNTSLGMKRSKQEDREKSYRHKCVGKITKILLNIEIEIKQGNIATHIKNRRLEWTRCIIRRIPKEMEKIVARGGGRKKKIRKRSAWTE